MSWFKWVPAAVFAVIGFIATRRFGVWLSRFSPHAAVKEVQSSNGTEERGSCASQKSETPAVLTKRVALIAGDKSGTGDERTLSGAHAQGLPTTGLGKIFDLPIELQHYILKFAIADSCSTHMSLLVASRWMNATMLAAGLIPVSSVCITSDPSLRGFAKYLDLHPHAASRVRHLLMCPEAAYSYKPWNTNLALAVNVLNRCSQVVSLGCNVRLLERVDPEACRNITWLSLEAPPRLLRPCLSWEHGAALSRVQTLHIASDLVSPGTLRLPVLENVKHLVVESRLRDAVHRSARDEAAFDRNVGLLPQLERFTYLCYREPSYREGLSPNSLPGWDCTIYQSTNAHAARINRRYHILRAAEVDNWKDVFKRLAMDERLGWKIPADSEPSFQF